MRLLVYGLAGIVCILVLFFWGDMRARVGVASGLLSAFSFLLIEHFVKNLNHLKKYYLFSVMRRNKVIRVSVSSLFRIKIDDKYLLVRSRMRNKFQPVGGVLKRLPCSVQELKLLEVRDDRSISLDETTENDLRVRVKGKHMMGFLQWLRSKQCRELSPWREFYEELIATKILDSKDFPYVMYSYIGIIETPIKHSDEHNCWQVRIAEINELEPTEHQKRILEELLEVESDSYRWATEEQIKREGIEPPHNFDRWITDHTAWII